MASEIKILNCEGALGIAEAGKLAEQLKELLAQKAHIIINLSRVEALDLSCIQVIIAAKKLAKSLGLSMVIGNQLSEEAAYAFHVCGMSNETATKGKAINKYLDDLLMGEL